MFICCKKPNEINKFTKTNKIPTEDISTLIETSLNSCKNAEQYYHLEIKERRNIYIVFNHLENPLTREIKCYGVPVKEKLGNLKTNDNVIKIYDCRKISSTKFHLHYRIVNEGADIKLTLEYIKNKWIATDCDVGEV